MIYLIAIAAGIGLLIAGRKMEIGLLYYIGILFLIFGGFNILMSFFI